MKDDSTVLIAGYGITVWTHEDSCPQREYYEVCARCAAAWEACTATATFSPQEAVEHNLTCVRCHGAIGRIPWGIQP